MLSIKKLLEKIGRTFEKFKNLVKKKWLKIEFLKKEKLTQKNFILQDFGLKPASSHLPK